MARTRGIAQYEYVGMLYDLSAASEWSSGMEMVGLYPLFKLSLHPAPLLYRPSTVDISFSIAMADAD